MWCYPRIVLAALFRNIILVGLPLLVVLLRFVASTEFLLGTVLRVGDDTAVAPIPGPGVLNLRTDAITANLRTVGTDHALGTNVFLRAFHSVQGVSHSRRCRHSRSGSLPSALSAGQTFLQALGVSLAPIDV